MIDTIRFTTDEYSSIKAFKQNCISNLSNLKHNTTKTYEYYTGNLFNFFISCSETMLSITGSLTKFYFDNNIQVMTKDEIHNAIIKLEAVLGFSLDNFKITKLDIGVTFLMDYSVHSYLDSLTKIPRYKKIIYPGESITFKTVKTKALSFYDKIEESMSKQKSKRVVMENDYKDMNLLRYELQIKQVTSVCGKTYGRDLKNDIFLRKVLNLWQSEYQKIEINKEILNFEEIETNKPKDFFDSLGFSKIDDIGKEKIDKLLLKKYKSGEIKQSSYFYMQNKIKDSKNQFTYTNKYIEELENKIDDFCNNYIVSEEITEFLG